MPGRNPAAAIRYGTRHQKRRARELARFTPGTIRYAIGGMMSTVSTETFYLLACHECASSESPLIMPFGTPADRGKWAAVHMRATGHNRWWVKDSSPTPLPA